MKQKFIKVIFLLSLSFFCVVSSYAQSIFIEAESFQNKGGWVVTNSSWT